MTSVIIIEDTPEKQEWICSLASQTTEVTVHAFATGVEGIAHFREHGADCIFLDNCLSREDALSVLAYLIATSPFAKVVLMLSEGNQELAATAVKAGAMACLPKAQITEQAAAQLIKDAMYHAEKDRNLGLAGSKLLHILLVEDNYEDRARIKELIENGNGGVEVSSVETGDEALDLFSAGGVDCVILDYRLEVEDGLDILARLKEKSAFTPVIMLTGQGNEEIAAKSIKVGAADYLIKQRLNITFLRTAIDNAISRSALEAKIADQEVERRQFLRTLVHDLRAPLRNVRYIGEMAIEESERGDLGEMKTLLAAQGSLAGRATNLIDTLESYTLLDADVSLETLELGDVARSAAANLSAIIAERKAELTIGDLPRVKGHASQLIQVFQNLISNGIKYNQNGLPRIIVETEMGSQGEETLVVVVRDNGIGIPNKHHRLIFEPLKRLWGQDSYEGTGLGLAICKKIMERHSGNIWCMSKEGEGSQFYVSFPQLPKMD